MEDNHKELITEIKEVLSAYEMPYEEGAWEAFNSPAKKNRVILWPWISIAATVLLVSTFWLINNEPKSSGKNNAVDHTKNIVKTPDAPKDNAADRVNYGVTNPALNTTNSLQEGRTAAVLPGRLNSSGTTNNIPDSSEVTTVPSHTIILPDATALLIVPEKVSVISITKEAILLKADGKTGALTNNKAGNLAIKLPELKKLVSDTNIKAPLPVQDNFMDFLVKEKQTAVAKVPAKTPSRTVKKSTESKWDFGVEVLPTVTSAAVNVGAGVLTAYKLSDHFSLGTGVAYTGLGSAVSHKPGISALDSKQLQSVNASYRAIDIPLNLVYNVNKKLYTSVGVSYINVVEERATNTFVSEQRSYSFDSAASSYSAGLSTQTTQESSQTQTLKGMGSLGFFNFSVGRKQEVFNKYHISIEPFIKVPVGKLSQQDLKLTNGGMKFKLEF
ncbi:MAG: hypothetical protein EOO88_27860 [Pedobacter sp.]|nr:MAG: hypothetical protein EOO88_27860 [Pedobacter sp.]